MSTTGTREQIISYLIRELVGPDSSTADMQGNEEEILTSDPPRIRYGAGVLFPQATVTELSEDTATKEMPPTASEEIESQPQPDLEIQGDDSDDGRGEEGTHAEDAIRLTNAYLPSALGLSCFAEIPADGLEVRVRAAKYLAQPREYELHGERKKGVQYRRQPISEPIPIAADELSGGNRKLFRKSILTQGAKSGLALDIVSRLHGSSPSGLERRLLTVTLVNENESPGGKAENDKCFFQVSLSIHAKTDDACFIEYPENEREALDDEEKSQKLLYRYRKTFAVGHGCAADWEEVKGRASSICSQIIPTFEVKPIVPARFPDLDLSMLELSDLGGENKVATLCGQLCDKYEQWIAEREADTAALEDDLKEAAMWHTAACRDCLQRMRRGLETLRQIPEALLAFRLANHAMLLQQLHYALPLREWKAGNGGILSIPNVMCPDVFRIPEGKGAWYPFQLAFLLLNITSLVLPEDPERQIVDLIWFPTGGGKTEAYLGLSAFTIFLRRLQRADNAGVTVLMRYTLRLLTTQQFQRAATLICACEVIRRDFAGRLGSEAISIGLWVGMGLTPNKRDEAVRALRKLTTKEEDENPFVLLRCPWCSAQLGPLSTGSRRVVGYELQRNPSTVIFRCHDKDCPFSSPRSLPLLVIDEDIYAVPPTLLIGTIDKFASLPWRPEARSLFGVDNHKCAPPDLIIQDELHLIGGPLGSIAGHFETVITELCAQKRGEKIISAKIVASTATIRRAKDQVKSLFARKLCEFPPPGLRSEDSFFAFEDETAPGRIYVGIHAAALPSHVTAQVRTFAALLQGAWSATVSDEQERDPYFTLVCYFNSLRELGHAATLLRADIREYLNSMWLRKGLTSSQRRFISNALELTSRVSSQEIPEALQELERNYPSETDRPVDVCLATNMISVGIDVPRLGLMAVVGEPKTTSEYIQATSRVGRSRNAPGLVVTLYHTGKPRDRSHYEHFRSYHAALYRQVEPTSVTPFAAPVRERALHSLIITLARFFGTPDNRARPQPFPSAALESLISEVITKRVTEVDAPEADGTIRLLKEVLSRWRRVLPARYGDFGGPPRRELPLMYPAGSVPLLDWGGKSFPTLTSMRNVDASCEALVLGQYPKPSDNEES